MTEGAGASGRGYYERGWTTFEYALSNMIKSANTTLRFYMTFRHAAHPEAFDPARSILAKYDGRVQLGMLRDLRQPDHA